jgi:protein-tyrosine phosphatase
VTLPAPQRDEGPYRIAVVCLGNICRSPMAGVILAEKVAASPLADRVIVNSSGTGDWHVGDQMDDRAAATLRAAGYDPSLHRARHFDRTWFTEHDLILAMDGSNFRSIIALTPGGDDDRVMMFRAFDPEAGADLDVPDPWYGGQDGFDHVLTVVERTTDALVDRLTSALLPPPRRQPRP